MNIIEEIKELIKNGKNITLIGDTLNFRYNISIDDKPTSADLSRLSVMLGNLIIEICINALRELGEYPTEQNPGEQEKIIATCYARTLETLAVQWKYHTAEMIRRSTPENLEKLWGKEPDSTNIEYYKRACERLDGARHLDKALIAAIKNDPQAVAKHLGFFQHPQEGQK